MNKPFVYKCRDTGHHHWVTMVGLDVIAVNDTWKGGLAIAQAYVVVYKMIDS